MDRKCYPKVGFMFCLNVRQPGIGFASRLVDGSKSIETRTKRALTILLKNGLAIGETVGIVSGGYLIGAVKVIGIKEYDNYKEFHDDDHDHLVYMGTPFDYDEKKGKVGIMVADPVKFHYPMPVEKLNHPQGWRVI